MSKPCPGRLALCGHPCGCEGRNPTHVPPPLPSRRATDLTNHVFARANTGDFHAAVTRVDQVLDEVLDEVRAEAYERGLAAGRREAGA